MTARADTKGCLDALLKILVGIPLGVIIDAAVVMWTWGWFVVPLGVPAVSLWQAGGISLVGTVLTFHSHGKQDDRSFRDWVVALIAKNGALLLVGWLLHLLMVAR